MMKSNLKVLFTAFNGKENSSRVLLDRIIGEKIYLKNSFINSVRLLEKELLKQNYDLIISFGQAYLDKDIIQIETTGQKEELYITKYDYNNLKKELEKNFVVKVSSNAGNYLCNNLYYNGLKYIDDNNLKTKMVFIHIPKIKNITDIAKLANIFNEMFR